MIALNLILFRASFGLRRRGNKVYHEKPFKSFSLRMYYFQDKVLATVHSYVTFLKIWVPLFQLVFKENYTAYNK